MARKRKKGARGTVDWAVAKKRCRLNAATVQMAKELGLTPRTLLRNIPSPNQRWKAPVHVWIRDLHAKRFGQPEPPAPPVPPGVGDDDDWDDDDSEEQEPWTDHIEASGRPSRREIAEQDQHSLALQARFRRAAEAAANALAARPSVERVVLHGSVVRPLEREVPRFRRSVATASRSSTSARASTCSCG